MTCREDARTVLRRARRAASAVAAALASHDECTVPSETVAEVPARVAADPGEPTTSARGRGVENTSDTLDTESNTTGCGDPVCPASGGDGAASHSEDAKTRNCGTGHESLVSGPLADLGTAFVPIPPRSKGARLPRTDEHLYAPDGPVLQGYLREGWNYYPVCDVWTVRLVEREGDSPYVLVGLFFDALWIHCL